MLHAMPSQIYDLEYIYTHSPHIAYVYITRSKPPWAPAEHTFNNSLVAVIKFALGRLGLLAERPTTISANVYELQSTSPTNIDAAWLAGSLHHHHGLGTVARHVDKCVFNVEGYGWICTTVALMYTSPRYGHTTTGGSTVNFIHTTIRGDEKTKKRCEEGSVDHKNAARLMNLIAFEYHRIVYWTNSYVRSGIYRRIIIGCIWLI